MSQAPQSLFRLCYLLLAFPLQLVGHFERLPLAFQLLGLPLFAHLCFRFGHRYSLPLRLLQRRAYRAAAHLRPNRVAVGR